MDHALYLPLKEVWMVRNKELIIIFQLYQELQGVYCSESTMNTVF